MKKIMLFIIAFTFLHPVSYAQQKGRNLHVDEELNWLLHYKREYERLIIAANRKNELTAKNTHARDSVYKLYVDEIEFIRKSPEKFLTHINHSIRNNKVEYDGPPKILYDHVNTSLPFDPDLHSVTRLELYKIVKKYIFEKQDKLLPHRTEAYIKAGGKGKPPMQPEPISK